MGRGDPEAAGPRGAISPHRGRKDRSPPRVHALWDSTMLTAELSFLPTPWSFGKLLPLRAVPSRT